MNNISRKNLLEDLHLEDIDKKTFAIIKLQELNLDTKEVIQAIIKFGLSSKDDDIRRIAIEALGKLGKNESDIVCPALVKLLNDPESLNRSDTLDALSDLDCKSVIPAIQNSLRKDTDWLVRVSALEALVMICEDDDLSVFKDFELALNDSDEIVISYAAWAIASLGRKEFLPKLEESLLLENSLHIKIDILAAKYRLGVKEDLKNLLEILEELNEDDDYYASLIVNALKEISKDSKLHLTLKEDIPIILETLAKISDLFPLQRYDVEQIRVHLESLNITP